jgi:hypothetical protein
MNDLLGLSCERENSKTSFVWSRAKNRLKSREYLAHGAVSETCATAETYIRLFGITISHLYVTSPKQSMG